MGGPWMAHGPVVGDPCDSTLTPRVTHGRPMVDIWVTHEPGLGDPWASTVNPWVTHGRPAAHVLPVGQAL